MAGFSPSQCPAESFPALLAAASSNSAACHEARAQEENRTCQRSGTSLQKPQPSTRAAPVALDSVNSEGERSQDSQSSSPRDTKRNVRTDSTGGWESSSKTVGLLFFESNAIAR